MGFSLPAVTPPPSNSRTFTDVTPDNVFYDVVETAAARGLISGYTCGGVNPQTGSAEPCDTAARPYYRSSNFVTRGQITKIVVIGANWVRIHPATPRFNDVGLNSVFYPFVETAVCHGILSGYSDGTFRTGNNAARGQISKIVFLAVTSTAVCDSAR